MYVIKATAKITGSENYMRQFTVKTPGVPYTHEIIEIEEG